MRVRLIIPLEAGSSSYTTHPLRARHLTQPHRGKKGFVKESRMKCSAEPHMSAEEEFAKAADAIKFDEIFFKKTKETLGKRPVYKQWKGDKWTEAWNKLIKKFLWENLAPKSFR